MRQEHQFRDESYAEWPPYAINGTYGGVRGAKVPSYFWRLGYCGLFLIISGGVEFDVLICRDSEMRIRCQFLHFLNGSFDLGC